MQLYSPNGAYDDSNSLFMVEIVQAYPQINFFQPSPEKAPWHVQAIIDSDSGRIGEINFWPHKLKVSYGGPAEVGIDAMHSKINEALNDAMVVDDSRGDFDLIEY